MGLACIRDISVSGPIKSGTDPRILSRFLRPLADQADAAKSPEQPELTASEVRHILTRQACPALCPVLPCCIQGILFTATLKLLRMQRVDLCAKASTFFKSLTRGSQGSLDQELTLLQIRAALLSLAKDVPSGSAGQAAVLEMKGWPAIQAPAGAQCKANQGATQAGHLQGA